MNYKDLRKVLALAAIILDACALGIPDITWSKFLVGLSIGLNSASLYLLKEEPSTPPESESVG